MDGAGKGLLYRGSFVYSNTGSGLTLESAGFSGGRFIGNAQGMGLIQYHITDHLGSVRVVVDQDGEVLERNNYYPFGKRWDEEGSISDNRYRFNGKEDQSFVGSPYVDYGARQYDPNLIIWRGVDAMAEEHPGISPFVFCNNNPVRFVDPDGMDWYVFNPETGEYEDKEEAEGTHRMMVRSYDKKGNLTITFYDFNDPEVDAKAIDNGKISKMEFLSDKIVETMMDESGVKTREARSSPISYAYREGHGGQKMDYGISGIGSGRLNSNTFYIRENIAYNVGDIGNYLWGRGMAELGIPVSIARIGAHYNNIKNGDKQKTSAYNFGKGTYDNPGFWDSPGDQRAIRNGHRSSPAGKKFIKRMESLMLHLH